jgi:hypothetical protein
MQRLQADNGVDIFLKWQNHELISLYTITSVNPPETIKASNCFLYHNQANGYPQRMNFASSDIVNGLSRFAPGKAISFRRISCLPF